MKFSLPVCEMRNYESKNVSFSDSFSNPTPIPSQNKVLKTALEMESLLDYSLEIGIDTAIQGGWGGWTTGNGN